VIGLRGVFFFSELATAHLPLAHAINASGLVNIIADARELAPTKQPLARSINASGLVNIIADARELVPTHPPLALAVNPLDGLDYVLRTSEMGSRGGVLV